MNPRLAAAAGLLLTAALASPARGACPEPAFTGVQPCDEVLRPAFQNAGEGKLGPSGWPIKTMYAGLGADRALVPGWVPCVVLSAVATTESNWHQFGYVACGQSAPTLVSFDCGYGIGQITSGMDGSGGFSPALVASDPVYNLSVSVNILISKWGYTSSVTPKDPKIAEDWYFALWGYNGLATKNNPNTHPDTVGTYYNPDNPAYPRASYAYQEVVYGYALYPRKGTDGLPRWPSTKITHPDFSEICASCANPGSSLVVSRPSPEHSGDCAATGPDWGAQYVSQSFPAASKGAVTLQPGETAAAHIELRNTGTQTWNASTRLATTEPRDRTSLFAGADWVAPNRPAAVSGTVPPGGTYKFQFTFQAPPQPGEYFEHFGVVQESVAWFSDPGQGGPADGQLEAKLVVLDGPSADAGASPPDGAAEASDSGPQPVTDAGRPDAGGDAGDSVETDGSPEGEVSGSGCGCATTSAVPWPLLVLGLVSLVTIRNRKR